VKLQKLHTRLRLASQANIAQVLGELKEYATEVDVDFVRKAVRAIGRCAIKVRVAARAAWVSYRHATPIYRRIYVKRDIVAFIYNNNEFMQRKHDTTGLLSSSIN
jgi:hypothetical protein